ncbi:hypothetical protein MVEN_00090600 [Mycena venus]|uniref:Transmembrane protein n=1 Tax=Mycena venus TaxID=2733690 RepID=A0A8H6Z813_9AGAR|nr:hypothetical protein MVEN_00090600 [Mycena venus]
MRRCAEVNCGLLPSISRGRARVRSGALPVTSVSAARLRLEFVSLSSWIALVARTIPISQSRASRNLTARWKRDMTLRHSGFPTFARSRSSSVDLGRKFSQSTVFYYPPLLLLSLTLLPFLRCTFALAVPSHFRAFTAPLPTISLYLRPPSLCSIPPSCFTSALITLPLSRLVPPSTVSFLLAYTRLVTPPATMLLQRMATTFFMRTNNLSL